MQYQVGKIGRVVVARGFDGEDVYAPIEQIARREGIRSGVVIVVGGLRSGRVVVGPKRTTGPIEATFTEFDDAREVVGVGTVFWDDDGPALHLHAGIGRGQEAIVGCPRGGATAFCVLEVVLIEIEGIDARRRLDAELGLKLLALANAESTAEP